MRVVGLVVFVLIVGAVGAAGFVGYELYQAYQMTLNPTAAPPLATVQVNGKQVVDFSSIPPDQLGGAIKTAQDKLISNVKDKQAFSLELSGTGRTVSLAVEVPSQVFDALGAIASPPRPRPQP